MADEVFVDTSGFYALVAKGDSAHAAASAFLRRAAGKKRRFFTTDYVLDETATLLSARGLRHLVAQVFEIVLNSKACAVEWMDPEKFSETRGFFSKRADQAWSFTDCFSFLVMRELAVSEALTKDRNFQEAGFSALLL